MRTPSFLLSVLGAAVFGAQAVAHPPAVPQGPEWSTFFGGDSRDQIRDVHVHADGRLTVVGITRSLDFPTTPGVFDPVGHVNPNVSPEFDGFVARIDPRLSGSAQLVWATYLGGSRNDTAERVAVSGDFVTVVGTTSSADFPTTPGAFDTSYNAVPPSGESDTFMALLSGDGSTLLYSTFLGGTRFDTPSGLALTGAGDVLIGGQTASTDLPTTPGAYQTVAPGDFNAFVIRLRPAGNGSADLIYGTFLGGSFGDAISSLTLESDDRVVVAGSTWSSDFPVTPGALQASFGGSFTDGFVARLRLDGLGARDLSHATYLGGIGVDAISGLALDAQGRVLVSGHTSSSDLPTTPGAYNRSYAGTGGNGSYDLFVARVGLTAGGASSLSYGTFLGGAPSESSRDMVLDGSGAVVLIGVTFGDSPTTCGALQSVGSGVNDVYLARLAPRGQGAADLRFATLFGGSGNDGSRAVAVDASGRALLVGETSSTDFPTTPGAFQETYQGNSPSAFGEDGFATLLLLDGGPETYCEAKLGSSGCLPAIDWSGCPTLSGADDFTITASQVPPQRNGLLLWSSAEATIPFHGGTLCVAGPRQRTPVQVSSGTGGGPCDGTFGFAFSQAYMAAKGLSAGMPVRAQWVLRDPGFAPPGNFGLSDALRFTIHP